MILQQAQIRLLRYYLAQSIRTLPPSRDILDRQQAGAEGGGVGGGGGGRGGAGGQGGHGEGRRVARPRMRGFTLGGFRFRFGIVFHTVHQQAAPAPQVAQAAQPPVVAAAAEEVSQQQEQEAVEPTAQPDPGDAAPAGGGGEGEESLQLRRSLRFNC